MEVHTSWPPTPISAGPITFEWGSKTYVMGIINVTPDSFSGDGLGTDVEAVVRQAEAFVAAGAHILDVGGESTRPGAEPVNADVERARVVPAIQAIAGRFDVAISVDTYKADVAAAALDAGAHIVNDVWGLRMDPAMVPLIAEHGVPVIVMHNRLRPNDPNLVARLGDHPLGTRYFDLIDDVIRELRESISIALGAGIPYEHIIVDPGIGFGKTVRQNLTLIDQLTQLQVLSRPILVGPSRKSFIGHILSREPGERAFGTAAVVALAIDRGADIVRVHDVAAMVDVARMTDAIVRVEHVRENNP